MSEGFAPSGSSGRMMTIFVVVLIIAILITAATVYYVFPQEKLVAGEDLPDCPAGYTRDPVYLSCFPEPPEPPAPTPKLKVIGPWAGAELDAFLPVMDLFTRQTGIEYEYETQRQEDLQTLLPTEFAAQQAPGDLIFMPSSFVKQYGIDGHAVDLAGTLTEGNYAAGALDPLKDGAAIYGGAYTGKVKPGFWYKKSYFAANGWSEPTTWAEFETLLANIDADIPGNRNAIISGDGVGWPLSDVTEHFLATYGGPQMHRDLTAGTLAWTDQTVKDALNTTLIRTMETGTVCVQSCWSSPRQWDTGVDEWWNGDYGLYFMGSWITGMVADPSDLGVFSLPEAPGAEGIVFAADYFFIPTYTDVLADAQDLAVFLSGVDAQTMQVRMGGHLATNKDVPLSAYPAVDAEVAGTLTGKEVLSDMDDTIGGTFQTTFWSELQLLWDDPTILDTVLANLEAAMP